jgi:hypothetical protein
LEEGITVKIHLKIIKGFGLLLLLFVLVSAVAVSDSTHKVSVTILSSSSEDSDDANTIVNSYTVESDSPNVHVKSVISGSGSSEITSEEDTIPTESTDSGIMPPDFQLDGLTREEYNDELLEWILSMLDEDPLLTIGDFPQVPQDAPDKVNIEY